MQSSKPTAPKVALAFAVAIIADVLQLPLAVAMATVVGAPAAIGFNIAMGLIVLVLLSVLLGFRWWLVPLLILEVVPALDLIPSWTAYVAYMLWMQKTQAATQRSKETVIDMEPVATRNSGALPPALPASSGPPQVQAAARLQQLEGLRQSGLVTEQEYQEKRRQILAEI